MIGENARDQPQRSLQHEQPIHLKSFRNFGERDRAAMRQTMQGNTNPHVNTHIMETKMFRKIALGFATAATLTALATSGALAHGGGHGMHGGGNWHGGFGHHRFYRSSFYVGGGSCYKTIFTSMGPRRINVCGDVF
jgi:hypothetical protein